MSTPIGTLGNVPTLTVGGRVFVDLVNLLILGASCDSSNIVQYGTFRKPNSSSGYTPSGITTFVFSAVHFQSGVSGTTNFVTVGYGDNDVGSNSATAPTTATVIFGAGSLALVNAGTVKEVAISFTVPNTKYPYMTKTSINSGDEVYALAYGYEV